MRHRWARSALAISSLLMIFAASGQQPANPPLDGDFSGFEKLPNLAPTEGATKEEKTDQWFHENALLIRNNEAVLDTIPVFFRHGKKFYSASDGGFFAYRGQFFEQNGRLMIRLRLFQSDYVAIPKGVDPYHEIKVYPVIAVGGKLEFNGVTYKPSRLPEYKTKTLLKYLQREPLSKP